VTVSNIHSRKIQTVRPGLPKKKPPAGGSFETVGRLWDQRIREVPELVTITGLSALMTRTVCA
jgi:hypothetical protein